MATRPTFDGTEKKSPSWADGDWGRPALSDHPEVEEGADFADLDESAQNAIRGRFIEQGGDDYGSLGYPVVNPATDALSWFGVLAARQRAAAENDSDVLSVAEDLWTGPLSEDLEEESAVAFIPGRGNWTAIVRSGEDVEITIPDNVRNAAQAFLDAKEEGLVPDSCGGEAGRGTQRANQIVDGDLGPEDFTTRENGTPIPAYLDSHSEDLTAEGSPTDWSEEEWSDCGNAQYAAWGLDLEWAETQRRKVEESSLGVRATHGDLSEGDYVEWDSSGGTAYGQIEMIAMGETVSGSLEDEDTEHETSKDNPGVIVELIGGADDGETVFHRPGELRKIDKDDIPDDRLDRSMPDSPEDLDTLAEKVASHFDGAGADDVLSALSQLDQSKEYMESAPAIKRPSEKSFARHCRDTGNTYYRDCAAWDQPAAKVTRADSGDRVDVTINTRTPDRHGTIILPKGSRLETYNENNPIVLINHDHTLPAGVSTVSVEEGNGRKPKLRATMEDRQWDLNDEEVKRWHQKVTSDPPIIRSSSIGALFHKVVPGREFDRIGEMVDTTDKKPRELPDVVTDWTLAEWSWVSVPSNPDATIGRGAMDRMMREAQSRIERVAQDAESALKHEHDDSVPSTQGRSSPDEGDEPPSESESTGGESRQLSVEEAMSIARNAASDEIDRQTGRK